MANAIVVEVLEFVRPIQLQVERACARRSDEGFDHAGRRQDAARRGVDRHGHRAGRAGAAGRPAPAAPVVLEPARQRVRSARRRRPRRHPRVRCCRARTSRWARPSRSRRRSSSKCATPGRALRADDLERIFSPFFTTKPQGTGPGPGDRAQGRGRARRPHRRGLGAGPRRDLPGHAAGRAVRSEVWGDSANGTHSGCRRSRFAAQGPGPRADQRRP